MIQDKKLEEMNKEKQKLIKLVENDHNDSEILQAQIKILVESIKQRTQQLMTTPESVESIKPKICKSDKCHMVEQTKVFILELANNNKKLAKQITSKIYYELLRGE